MNKMLLCICLLSLLELTGAAKVYELHMVVYKNDSVKLLGFNVTEGRPGTFPSAGQDNYAFRILSKNGQVLFNQSFQMDFTAYRFRGPNSTESDVVPLSQIEDYWRLPYYQDAAMIELFHDGNKIFEYRLMPEKKPETPLACPPAIVILAALLLCSCDANRCVR